MKHWAEQYLNDTWQADGNGPHAWNCWNFIRHVLKTHYSVEVPLIDVDAMSIHAVIRALRGHDEKANWIETHAPMDGDGVYLHKKSDPSHVGIYLEVDGGGVLHCQQGFGVLFTPRNRLIQSGWQRATFWRRAV